ncbi:MAG TPA: AmmeMemoRadiSam system protein A [Candidatus Acidoferrales bacterium]|nr:AmmeMemoRadiSam system protein A [Candidatus Acidoferrales bacterium]
MRTESVDLPPDSQKRLLSLARQTLETFVRGEGRAPIAMDDPFCLETRYGVFVSLHRGRELRGCIGTCSALSPLYREVIEMTEAAASRDYRMNPIQSWELREISIELSILSPLWLVSDPLAVEIGKHGLYLVSGDKRGVLLPQVAVEYGWGVETFLRQACLKAGLLADAWRWPETRISAFTALILKEER